MEVLLAARNRTVASGITNALYQCGCSVVRHAADVEDALEELRRKAPDLLVAMWNLPPETGVELIKRAHADPECPDVPTLMLSPHDDRYRVVQALKAGADGYLLRPFSPKELAAAIDKALDRSAVA